ncbi:hypothetical protein V4R08_16230 (plasmid) [Nitrobacter sp. NHB1]|uniref:hypothetical protein n=1 Tax=Nitrobacter sp. NHB1 TaxID=3119830 RepID=UPI002FFF40D3
MSIKESKQIEAETTFSALRDLSTLDNHDDVDRAPDERAWRSISERSYLPGG